MAGIARCSSHSSDARVQAAAHFCAPATATRMMRARELASSSAGAARPSGRANAATASCTPDRASTSRSVVRASQASSSSPADRGPLLLAALHRAPASWPCGWPASPPAPSPTASAGTAPGRTAARYSSAIRATSGVICARRELNASITSWSTPPISNPFPSARGTSTYPRSVSREASSREACAATASRSWNSIDECSVRHFSSAPSPRWARFITAMCTCSCGSPSREVC